MKTKQFGNVTFKIDRPKGYVKTWDQPNGRKKVFVYPVDYGFFPGHLGEDDEGLDAFVGDDPNGHFEAFQKLKRNDEGQYVLDETKFLVGVSDAEREKIYSLYGPEVWARRVFYDVKELLSVASKFKPARKDRYKTASVLKDNTPYYRPSRNPTVEEAARQDQLYRAMKDLDRKSAPGSDENTFGQLYQEGIAQ